MEHCVDCGRVKSESCYAQTIAELRETLRVARESRDGEIEKLEAECDALRDLLKRCELMEKLDFFAVVDLRRDIAAALAKHSGPVRPCPHCGMPSDGSEPVIPEEEKGGIPKDLWPGESLLQYVQRKNAEH